MVIKFCPHCPGKPYTEDVSQYTCPQCGTLLESEITEVGALLGRTRLQFSNSSGYGDSFNTTDSWGWGNESQNQSFGSDVPGWGNKSEPTDWKWGEGPDPTGWGDNSNENPFEFDDMGSGSNMPAAKQNTAGGFPIPANDEGSTPVSQIYPPTDSSSTAAVSSAKGTVRVYGKIASYTNTIRENSRYGRMFITKLIDAICYRQRMEDVLHSFTVRVTEGIGSYSDIQYRDIPVNVHGTITGGLQLADNQEVEISGKMRNGILMAESILVVSSNHASPIHFQHSQVAALYAILAAGVIGCLIYAGVKSDGAFFDNIGRFLKIWGITFAVCVVLYFVLSLSKTGLLLRISGGGKRRFPLLFLILFSLIIALLIATSPPIGGSLAGFFLPLLKVVIVIVALFFIIKLLVKGR